MESEQQIMSNFYFLIFLLFLIIVINLLESDS